MSAKDAARRPGAAPDGTLASPRSSGLMQTPQTPPDPADTPPDERRKVRGSQAPTLGPWVVVMLILIVAAGVYALATL